MLIDATTSYIELTAITEQLQHGEHLTLPPTLQQSPKTSSIPVNGGTLTSSEIDMGADDNGKAKQHIALQHIPPTLRKKLKFQSVKFVGHCVPFSFCISAYHKELGQVVLKCLNEPKENNPRHTYLVETLTKWQEICQAAEGSEAEGCLLKVHHWESTAELFIVIMEEDYCSLHDVASAENPSSTMKERRSEVRKYLGKQQPRDLLRPILNGICLLHKHGIVHSAIKPANILLQLDTATETVTCKLGIAGFVRPPTRASRDNRSHISQTYGFLAPEVMDGDKPTPKSDVFAFGVLLAYVYTKGTNPFVVIDETIDPATRATLDSKSNIYQQYQYRVANGKFSSERIEQESVLACNLATQLVSSQPNKRPTAFEASQHPFFWDDSRHINLVCAMAGGFDFIERVRNPDATRETRMKVEAYHSLLELVDSGDYMGRHLYYDDSRFVLGQATDWREELRHKMTKALSEEERFLDHLNRSSTGPGKEYTSALVGFLKILHNKFKKDLQMEEIIKTIIFNILPPLSLFCLKAIEDGNIHFPPLCNFLPSSDQNCWQPIPRYSSPGPSNNRVFVVDVTKPEDKTA